MSDERIVMRTPRTAARLVALVASAAALASFVVASPAQAAPTVRAASAAHPIRTDACPGSAPASALRDGSAGQGVALLCRQAVAAAPTAQAKKAIRAAFHMLGAPYACNGDGRLAPWRYDCASLVSRAYEAAGVDTAGPGWSSSTRDMVPWGGSSLAGWAAYVAPGALRPGDLVLYNTGSATARHVVMYIGNGYMLHTGYCGDVAHISEFWGFKAGGKRTFLVARRVILPGQPTSYGVPSRDTASRGGSSSGVAAYPGRSLRLGSTGAAVTSLQRALIRKGYSIRAVQSGSVSFGSYGPQTFDAVAQYQSEHGKLGSLQGTVGARLYRTITGWKGSAPTTSKPQSGGGSTSGRVGKSVSVAAVLAHKAAAVRVIQAALNYTVGAGVRVDGRWTSATQAGFNQFRREVMKMKGTAATGAPGRGSITVLGSYAGFKVTA